jgi:DNA invertase Pin-like site-specific DNA recombinase
MRERTMDGLAAARARGRTGGQKPKLSPRQIKLVREAYDRRACTVAEIAADFCVTRQTVYRALKKTETGTAPRA